MSNKIKKKELEKNLETKHDMFDISNYIGML